MTPSKRNAKERLKVCPQPLRSQCLKKEIHMTQQEEGAGELCIIPGCSYSIPKGFPEKGEKRHRFSQL